MNVSLDISCDRCGAPLVEPGGLVFSPPTPPHSGAGAVLRKFHVCRSCWPAIEAVFADTPAPASQPEHRGHGEGIAMFIGRVRGCPACDAAQEQMDHRVTEYFVESLQTAERASRGER